MTNLLSIVIYLFVFFISIYFTYCAQLKFEKYDRNQNKITFRRGILFSVAAMFLPVILAAFRADSVGTDVTVYAIRSFEIASTCKSIKDLWFVSNGELLFFLTGFILSKLGAGISAFLGMIQLLTILPIYIGAYKLRREYSMWFTMAGYFFLFYNLSLNVMRQSICVAFVFLAFSYFLEKRYKLCIILCVVSSLFHNSAILGILILSAMWYLNKGSASTFKKFISVIFIFLAIAGIGQIGSLLYNLGIIKSNYLSYITRLLEGTFSTLQMEVLNESSIFYLVLHFLFWLIPFVASVISKKNNKNDRFFSFLMFASFLVYSLILYFLQTIIAYRITLFWDIFIIIYFPTLRKMFVHSKETYILNNTFVLIFYFCYWYILFIYCNWHGTGVYMLR